MPPPLTSPTSPGPTRPSTWETSGSRCPRGRVRSSRSPATASASGRKAGGAPVALADAVVSFTMSMPMGDHRHALVPASDGWQEAEAVLPLCPSGKRRWFGRLDFTLGGRARSARFAFDVAPAAGRP